MAEIAGSVVPYPQDMMQNYKWLGELLLAQPGTREEFQPAWQANKYMLHDKMYAYMGVNDKNGRPIVTLKLEPLFSELLRSQYDDIVPGYYMNKVHWSTVYLDGTVPQAVFADMVSASYKLMLASLSKKAQREILGE